MYNFAIYVHWPFCITKCPYCDFNSHKIIDYEFDDWLNAYSKQLDFFKNYLISQGIQHQKLKSIFFGGGTPSIMKPKMIEKILNKIFKLFSIEKNIEISIEANPSRFEKGRIFKFKELGFNRISIGVQGLNNDDLKFLGRTHSIKDVYNILDETHKCFKNISADLIYALVCQNIKTWEKELVEFLKKFQLQHISAYQLTLEKGTEFYSLHKEGKFSLANDNKYIKFYSATKDILSEFNLSQYEISNFSRPSFQSEHNKIYWKSENWIGIGPGAVSRLWDNKNDRIELINFKKPSNWLKSSLNKDIKFKSIKVLKKKITQQEILIMGLRLVEGIELNKFSNVHFLSSEDVKNYLQTKVLYLYKGKILINKNYFKMHDYIVRKIIYNF